MSPVREQEFDAPWKYALEITFELFLRLFLLDLHAIVDWIENYDSMDQELQKLMPESATGVRRVDKLFKTVRQGTGDPRYFHIEAQAQPQEKDEFGARMYTYSYRGRDLLGQPIISIAILSDDDPKWHPRKHKEGELGSEVTFTFRTVKVLKRARRQRQLEEGENVFGLFVSAHLEALKTRANVEKRAEGKIQLLTNLVKRGLSDLERGQWYHLIDWILPLPRDKELQVFHQIQGEKPVTYITFAERLGMEKGERAALLRSLRALLKAKFGEEGVALLEQLPEETPIARLEALSVQVALAVTIDTLRQ